MPAKFLDGGMIVIRDLVGERQVGGIEDSRLAAEQPEQPGRLLDDEPRLRAFAQAAIKQQDARRRIDRSEAEGRSLADIFGPERRKMVRLAERSEAGR